MRVCGERSGVVWGGGAGVGGGVLAENSLEHGVSDTCSLTLGVSASDMQLAAILPPPGRATAPGPAVPRRAALGGQTWVTGLSHRRHS